MLISLAWAPDKMSHIDIQAASSNLKAHWLVKDDVITLLIGSSGAGKEGGRCASKVRGSDGAGDEGGWSGRVIEREDADQLLGGGFCELWYLPCRSVWGYFVTVRTTVMWAAAWALPRIRERATPAFRHEAPHLQTHLWLWVSSQDVPVWNVAGDSNERWHLNPCRNWVSPRCRGDLGVFSSW